MKICDSSFLVLNISGTMKLQRFLSNNTLTKELQKQRVSVYKWDIIWSSVIIHSYIHLAALYGLYLTFLQAKYWTILWFALYGIAIIFGVTAGAHRLWSHRSYKAKWPMRLILMILHTAACQGSIYRWARDHRVHHKYTDTDADPHNANRGLFFSHIGWLLIRKHPKVIEKGALIDCSDLERDSLVTFQRRWYNYISPICGYILPTLIPYWYWGELLSCAWHLNIFRYWINLQLAFVVNSLGHTWGTRPYDKSIRPTDNFAIAMATFGEGWHNYHHVFPWDYRTGEFGTYRINITTAFINVFAFLGLAYDLRTTSLRVIKQHTVRNEITQQTQ